MTARNRTDRPAAPVCLDCGYPLPVIEITHSTIPVEAVPICPNCPGAEAKWAEHYDGDILRFPPIDLGAVQ